MELFRKKERCRVDEEGKEWVLKYQEKRILGIDTGLFGKEQWFPVSDVNTDRLVVKASLLGFLGAHRFSLGEMKEGMFYLLTCGCAGILPALDILSYLLGRGSHEILGEDGEKKRRAYLRKPEGKAVPILGMGVTVLISFLCMRFLYPMLFSLVGTVLSEVTGSFAGEVSFPL